MCLCVCLCVCVILDLMVPQLRTQHCGLANVIILLATFACIYSKCRQVTVSTTYFFITSGNMVVLVRTRNLHIFKHAVMLENPVAIMPQFRSIEPKGRGGVAPTSRCPPIETTCPPHCFIAVGSLKHFRGCNFSFRV